MREWEEDGKLEGKRQWTQLETFASPVVSPKTKCFIILTLLTNKHDDITVTSNTKILLLSYHSLES